MNHIQKDLLVFAASTTRHWKNNFESSPEVWIGIGRPQHRLTKNQKLIAQIAVLVTNITLETIIERV